MRVVVAEDLTLLRDGLIRIFQAYGFEVVEAVDNGPSLVRALDTHRPDVAVVDVRLPPTFTDEGRRAAIDAPARIPGLSVLMLSQYVEQLYALLRGEAGQAGCDALDVRAHAEAPIDVKGLAKVLDALGGVAGGEVVLGEAFEGDGFAGGCVYFAAHGQGLLVEGECAGAVACGGDGRGVVGQRPALVNAVADLAVDLQGPR